MDPDGEGRRAYDFIEPMAWVGGLHIVSARKSGIRFQLNIFQKTQCLRVVYMWRIVGVGVGVNEA